MCLYVGYVSKVQLRSALAVFLRFICFGIVAVYADWQWFYHDLPSEIRFTYLILLSLSAILFVSPIMINSGVRSLKQVWASTVNRNLSAGHLEKGSEGRQR